MSEEGDKKRKVAKRRRNLPPIPPSRTKPNGRKDDRRKSIEKMPRTRVEDLRRLSTNILRQLHEDETTANFMPGFVEDITGSEIAGSGDKVSTITLKSGKQVQITMKDGSFRRITGLREHIDASGSFIIRRVEIKKELGKSLGFYIREGDGWMQKTGIFVSRINLGSVVDINRLLNVGDEIIRINNVDITSMALDDVVLIMQFVQKIILTVKVLRGVADTLHNLKKRRRRELPKTPSFLEGKVQVGQPPIPKVKVASKFTQRPQIHQASSSKQEPDTIKVDMHHSYEDVDFGDNIEKSPKADHRIQPYDDVDFSENPTADRKTILPYSKLNIPLVASSSLAEDTEQRNGQETEDNDDINPYAQVSAELQQKLMAQKKDADKPSESSSPPAIVVDIISPYSEVRRPQPEKKSVNASAMTAKSVEPAIPLVVDPINPYSEVKRPGMRLSPLIISRSPEKSGFQTKPPVSVISAEDNAYSPVSNVKLRKAKGTPPVARVPVSTSQVKVPVLDGKELDQNQVDEVEDQFSTEPSRLSFLINDQIPQDNKMGLDGLLDIIKTAQFGPRSPVVRRSFILEESEEVEPVLDPSHIYAEVKRNKEKNTNHEDADDDCRLEEVQIDITPPSPPKTPVPFDSEDNSPPLITPTVYENRDQDHQDTSSNANDKVVSRNEGQRKKVDAKEAENKDTTFSEALAELDQNDIEAPPLPPPYVPDEGPPGSSDSEDEGEGEHKKDLKVSEDRDNTFLIAEGPSHYEMSLYQEKNLQVEVDRDSTVATSTHGRLLTSDDTNNMAGIARDGEKSDKEYDDSDSKDGTESNIERFQEIKSNISELSDSEEPSQTANIFLSSLSDLSSPPPIPQAGPPEPPVFEQSPNFSEALPEHTHSTRDCIPEEKSSSSPLHNSITHLPKRPHTDSTSSSSPSQLPPELPPPPPLPSVAPPDDGDDDEEFASNASDSSENEEDSNYTRLPTMVIQDVGTSSPTDQRFSGSLLVKISKLDISSKKSTNFWSTNAINKMIFILSVDNCVKINTTIPLEPNLLDISEDDMEYQIIIIQNFHVKFSLHSICLPTVSKCAKLTNIFPSHQPSSRNVLVSFDQYGMLQLTLIYRPMSSMVRRLNPEGSSLQARFSDHVILNSSSNYPLIVEQSLHAVEKFGLKVAHLYDRCASKLQKQRALASCMEDLDVQELKKTVTTCSVHAYTGVLLDFFCDLPEPFFTNKLSLELTRAASLSREPEVLDQFLNKLPKHESQTLKRLLLHFKTVCHHGSKNGVSVKLLSRLFGPLLLTPSLSPTTESEDQSQLLEFAEDYFSQSRVIELLMARDSNSS